MRIRRSKIASVVAAYTIVALVIWLSGAPFTLTGVQAADVTSFSDTITDSDLSQPSNHTISFVSTSTVDEGDTIELTFAAGFDLSAITEDDVDVASSTVDLTTAATCGGAEEASVATSSQTLIITICAGDGGAIAAGATIEVEIGTNATASGVGANQIVNPSSAAAYTLDLAGTFGDTGQTRIVVLDDVTVSAAVDATFSFTLAGLDAGEAVNGTSTTGTSTATSLPFGTLNVGSPSTLAQRLTVTTNASGGFVVTVVQDNNLESSTGSDIDQFVDSDAAGTSTPTAWVSPAGQAANEWTHGHFGFTSEDADLNGGEFGSNEWAGNLGSPRQIFSNAGPADGTTPNVGVTDVGYQVEISNFQQAGNDYSNTLTYVVTPTF